MKINIDQETQQSLELLDIQKYLNFTFIKSDTSLPNINNPMRRREESIFIIIL